MDLIDDLELGNKDAEEIHFAVVWDDSLDSNVTAYNYLDLENSHCEKVTVTGVDKALRCVQTGRDIPILTVKPMVKIKS